MTVVIMIYTAVAIDGNVVKSRDKRKISISDYKVYIKTHHGQ